MMFDSKKPTALFIGRYQPFHEGHLKLILEGLRRVGQVCIAVRNTGGNDDNNPYSYEEVRSRIEQALTGYEGQYEIVLIPNITHVFYGRGVGYSVERIELDPETEAISATKIRGPLPPPKLEGEEYTLIDEGPQEEKAKRGLWGGTVTS